MQKRFSREARNVVVAATNSAALLGAEQTEAEHFLIALLVGPASKAREYLLRHGLTRSDVELAIADAQESDVDFDDEDTAALAAFGFDLPRILQQLEERFGSPPPRPSNRRGPRRLTVGFGETGKRVMHQALLEASVRDGAITPEHILLGLLRDPSPTCSDLIAAYWISYEAACEHVFPSPQSNAS